MSKYYYKYGVINTSHWIFIVLITLAVQPFVIVVEAAPQSLLYSSYHK